MTRLVHAAQVYLARRAASRLQLARVLTRKAQRSAAGQEDIDRETLREIVEAAVDRIVDAGWIDDATLGATRAAALARGGLPANAIRRRLAQQGLTAERVADDVRELDDETQARRYAERKRLGPFASGRRIASPERDIRAMVRAGFSPGLSRRVLDRLAAENEGLEEPRTGHDYMNDS